MRSLIRLIRHDLNMNQTEFAELLNVTFATVNRWENGRTIPNKLAQTKLYDIAKDHSIPVYEYILNKIQKETERVSHNDQRLILYHGSKAGIEGSIEPKSRSQCDFGKGFYMVTDPNQALTLICDYELSKFYITSLDTTNLNTLEVPVSIDWAMLVAFNRGKMNGIKNSDLFKKYLSMTVDKDLIIGCIADDRMFYVLDNFFIGNITDRALIGSLSALQLGKQYVAITQKACDSVKIVAEIELSHLERLCIKEVAESNRTNGISLANDICKRYRREGLYFDELLENSMNGDV